MPAWVVRVVFLCGAWSAVAPHGVSANPTGATVVSGQASFVTSGNRLDITSTPGAILHWQGFSIGADEITRFLQQDAASSVLNRVVGQDPSVILGSLQSNGRVFLINPSGVLFGEGARIDVGGLVASTLHLDDQDFLAGRYRFESGGNPGAIENRGAITTTAHGGVWLIAPEVTNHGAIAAPGGEILLAAGKRVLLVDAANPALRVEVTATEERAVNLGSEVPGLLKRADQTLAGLERTSEAVSTKLPPMLDKYSLLANDASEVVDALKRTWPIRSQIRKKKD